MNRPAEETFRQGDVVGRYRVVERIGGGGMGDVYRARDLDLDRDVALKVLPADVATNEDRVRRFVQEAKSASALNHPNIVTVHEVGTAGNVPFIAMELIDGETFRARIQRKPRDLKALLGYAAQAADALAKAHAAGIVHRDLKPDNLMVTRDGFAKVLDFGLAKLTEPQRPDPDGATAVRPQTREGLVMGTVGYMSPEQAEGRAVDHRSDIFSFGCILYEAATGQRPFGGRTEVDVLHAIIHDEPRPITEMNPAAPAELRRIVRRCLAKDPDQRIQSMKDLGNTLRDLVDEFDQLTPGSGSSAPVPRVERTRVPWVLAGVAIAASAILAGWALMRRDRAPSASPPAIAKTAMTIRPITTTGKAAHAALSPDGRYLAYNTFDGQKVSLRMRQLATGSEVEIFPLSEETRYLKPQFTPDGNYLYVRREIRGSSVPSLVSVPALGGPAREVIRDIRGSIDFSADGRQFVFVRRTPKESALVVADADGGNERVLVRRRYDQPFGEKPSWSPDGKWIAAAHRDTTGGLRSVLLLVSPDGKTVRPFGRDRWYFVPEMEWLPDMSAIAITGFLTDTGAPPIWLISYPDGAARRVTSDLNWYGTLAVSGDGKAIVATQGDQRGQVARVDPRDGSVHAVTDDRLRAFPGTGFSVANDGRIYYHSTESGSPDIWVMEPDGTTRQLTSLPGAEFFPAVSPSQDTIYYQYENGDRLELHAVSTTGAGRRVVAQLPPMDGLTFAAPDGRSVIISASTKKVVVPLDGAAPRPLDLPPGDPRASLSPDGMHIGGFFRLGAEEGRRFQLAIVPLNGGAPVRVFETSPFAARIANTVVWTSDGKNLVYIDGADGNENLAVQPVAGGAPRRLTSFQDAREILSLARGPESSVYVVRVTTSSDIVRITDFR